MSFADILYSVENNVARITMNKPEKMNAATWSTWAEVESAIALAEDDDDVRAVLITGAGRGFCAGTDLTDRRSEDTWSPRPGTGRKMQYKTRYLGPAAVYHCTKPTIAAVNGAAVGAGFSLALSADIRIASESARFAAIFTKRGISADTGTTWFLPRLVGVERALEMMYTGRIVNAAEALSYGLVSEVVPAEDLAARAATFAESVAHGPSLAIELDKRLVREAFTRTLNEQVEMEQYLQAITQRTEDAAEGRNSFLEKRDPVFKGR